jgi:hypothetical protein
VGRVLCSGNIKPSSQLTVGERPETLSAVWPFAPYQAPIHPSVHLVPAAVTPPRGLRAGGPRFHPLLNAIVNRRARCTRALATRPSPVATRPSPVARVGYIGGGGLSVLLELYVGVGVRPRDALTGTLCAQ